MAEFPPSAPGSPEEVEAGLGDRACLGDDAHALGDDGERDAHPEPGGGA